MRSSSTQKVTTKKVLNIILKLITFINSILISIKKKVWKRLILRPARMAIRIYIKLMMIDENFLRKF